MAICVITGASSGLDLALAPHYLRQGAVVGAIARRADLLQSLSDQFSQQVHCYALDMCRGRWGWLGMCFT